MIRHAWLPLAILTALTAAACTGRQPSEALSGVTTAVPSATARATATSAPATATSTPSPRPASTAAPDWTVVGMEHPLSPERFRLTVILGGKERTLNASRICYEAAVVGQVLPETTPSPRGYDVDCHVGD